MGVLQEDLSIEVDATELVPAPVIPLDGIPILLNSNLTTRRQIRFPKSKKRRIKKKWQKRHENWRVEIDPNIYCLQDPFTRNMSYVMHPAIKARLDEIIESEP